MIIERGTNTITITGLPIADVNNPGLPNDYFNEVLRKSGDSNIPKDLLLKIIELNRIIRKKIIDESKLIDNQVSNMLIKVIKYEMNLLSNDN